MAIIMRNTRTKTPVDDPDWVEECKLSGRRTHVSRWWRRRIRHTRPMLLSIFVVLGLTSAASAQAPKLQCAFVPLCLTPFSPPLDGIRLYENGTKTTDIKPMWFPSGNVRTSIVTCTFNTGADIKPCVYRGTQEFCGIAGPPTGVTLPPLCGSGPYPATYKMTQLQTFGQLFNSAPQTCAKNASCLKLLFDRCLADEACADELVKNLGDVDQDGVVTGGDYYWWEYILGEGRKF